MVVASAGETISIMIIWSHYADIAQSGVCTCVLNISQMRMVAEVGPVSNTILENVKSILIITIGGYTGGVSATGANALGVLLAIIGAVG